MSAKFGPAGNSDSFSKAHKSSLAAPKWIADFGLDCYEYQYENYIFLTIVFL